MKTNKKGQLCAAQSPTNRNKDTKSCGQYNRVYKSFQECPKTMLEVAHETGIDRANICWYVRKFRKKNKVVEVKKGLCVISRCRASYLSTDDEIIQAVAERGGAVWAM